MFAILAHERLQPTWPLCKWPGEIPCRQPWGHLQQLLSGSSMQESAAAMALVYVFEPVCLKSAHDAINFSSGLHRKYCTEIVNLLYSEGYTGPPSASCSFLFSSCSLSPAAPSDFSLAARSSALAVLAPYLHANEMFNYYVIKIGSCKYTWYKQHH